MAMTSEMVLSYHFKDSVICPIFTFFVFTFSSIYIYKIPHWCSIRSQQWFFSFAW